MVALLRPLASGRSGAPAGYAPPEPPRPLPPGRTVHLPGRGEVVARDSGGDGPAVLLLHGWLFSADLNWHPTYGALIDAGYRVLAVDHRGHGRGIRTSEPFRLEDCAHDAAALLRELGAGPAICVGYSMGGPVAALLAREHPDLAAGLVLCATALEWQDARTRAVWAAMGGVKLWLGLAPDRFWELLFRRMGLDDPTYAAWLAAQLGRGNPRDLVEAGRELGRYDARPWIGSLTTPAVVVRTTRDTAVPPGKQTQLARALHAPVLDVDGDHLAVTNRPERFNAVLLDALGRVRERAGDGRVRAAA